jgi:hypothetical protein
MRDPYSSPTGTKQEIEKILGPVPLPEIRFDMATGAPIVDTARQERWAAERLRQKLQGMTPEDREHYRLLALGEALFKVLDSAPDPGPAFPKHMLPCSYSAELALYCTAASRIRIPIR